MILIVDDNRENIFSLKTLLELNSFSVDTASSGSEALKKILKQSYSLIILDVQMPDMDGFEVAEAVSGYSKSKDIPIIFLSAVNTHKKFITKGYTSGGIDYVTKPFDPDILLLKVKTFYKLSEQTQSLNLMEKELRDEIELRKQAEAMLEKKVLARTQDLLNANRLLEERNKELQQFAFIASHDLQEPLRKIQIFSNLGLERHIGNQDKIQGVLQKISASATRLREMVSDLLEYSRIYGDDRFTSVNLNDVVQNVLADLEVQINETSCKITVTDLVTVEGVGSQLYQLFQNIIGNSIKFHKPHSGCLISVTCERIKERSITSPSNPEGKYCRIKIEDNGIGFDNVYAEKIFEIFQRLNNRSSFQGSGIGLAVVKKIVDMHHGLIEATGQEGIGAAFTIVLPLKRKYAWQT